MTCKQLVESIVNAPNQDGYDMDKDNAAKLIAIAYYIGRESATREVSDQYKKLIAGQRERANQSRYYNLAKTIIGDDYIYFSDYAGDMTETFGIDSTALTVEQLNN